MKHLLHLLELIKGLRGKWGVEKGRELYHLLYRENRREVWFDKRKQLRVLLTEQVLIPKVFPEEYRFSIAHRASC